MRSLKVLYLMTEPFGIGGVQSDILALTEDLSRHGHKIYVVSKEGPLVSELQAKGAEHFNIDLWFRTPSDLFRGVKRVVRFLKENQVDIISPQSVRSTITASLARRFLDNFPRPPIVTTIHNIHSAINYYTAGYILNWLSDFVIFESNYERQRLIHKGLNVSKTTVVHSGIDLERFQPRARDKELLGQYHLPAEAPIIGTVARFSEEKGYPYLLEAFTLVLKKIPSAVLFLIGDGPLKDEMKAKTLSLGLKKNVIFAGVQREIPKYLSLFNLFALASTRESFPLAAREAMASGKPVIATQVGGCHEVVEDGITGFLLPPARPDLLAGALIRILSDHVFAQELGKRGRFKAEKEFSRNGWIDGNEQIFFKFANRNKG